MPIPESSSDIAAQANFRCRRGNVFSRTLEFWNADETVQRDVTGSTFRMDVVDPKKNNKVILAFTMAGGLSIVDGNLVMSKTAVEMEVDAGIYDFDLEETDAAGNIYDKVFGQFIIIDDKTK